ncbi:MAG: tRNA lysidine(34) synthetase, partial [Hyphomicrobiaceae bacterium]
VDHGLRAQAAEEAAFVAQEAARLDLPCELLRWEGAKPTSGIQDAARNARRDLMLDVLRAERAVLCGLFREQELAAPPDRCIVMAHTLEDQAETVLMRLMRGSGLEGLGGMHPRGTAIRAPSPERPDHFEADVARPLLGLHKARLVATLEACGARWVVDPSNEDERFERVRVRQVLTQLESVGLSAEKVALSARRLRDADGALDALSTLDWRCARPHLAEVALPMDFRRTPYLLVRVLRALTIAYGGAARLAELSQLEAIAAQFLCDGGLSAFRGATVGGCKIELVRCRKPDPTELCMRIYREGSGEGLPVLHISPGQRVDWDGRRFTVVARHGALPHAVVEALGLERWAQAKRHVAGLGDLGLPAAAVATLPVVGDDRSGDVISYCGLDEALRHLRAAAMGSGGRDVAPAFWQNWEIWSKKAGAGYEATFSGPVRAAIGASH